MNIFVISHTIRNYKNASVYKGSAHFQFFSTEEDPSPLMKWDRVSSLFFLFLFYVLLEIKFRPLFYLFIYFLRIPYPNPE
jgi:hypothetical protein